jgi:hypothetical protein
MTSGIISGKVFTSTGVDPTRLRVRVQHPRAREATTRLGVQGQFTLPLHFPSDAPGLAPDVLRDVPRKLEKLGFAQFLRMYAKDTSMSDAMVAQILAEDPSLLVDDGVDTLGGRIDILDGDMVLRRRSFYYDARNVREPAWLSMTVDDAALFNDLDAPAAPPGDWQAQLGRILEACGVPYGPGNTRDEPVSMWRSAATLTQRSGWDGVFTRSTEQRTKTIHQFGVVAGFDFQPVAHGFDGVFSTAAQGVIRMTFGLNDPSIVVPGIALQFPVTGLPSLNIVALPAAQGRGQIRTSSDIT